jgi:hypothetical protein
MIATFIAIVTVSFALGCATRIGPAPATPRGGAAPASPPPWYLAPPSDSEAALYGVGSAAELPAAKSAALVDIASKLLISVRATLEDRSVVHNDHLEERIESVLVATVRDREFHAYDVVESALSGSNFYALIRVDRSRLILDAISGLRELDRDIEAGLQRASDGSSIAFYLAFVGVEPLIARAEANIELLSLLSNSFDGGPYLERHRAYRDLRERARAHAIVALLPDSESARVVGVVQELISDAGLQTGIVGAGALVADACRTLCIEIVSKWQRRYAARRHIARLTATFRLRDAAGSVAAVREHRVEATALSGWTEAEVAAAEKLRDKLAKDGILTAVGFTSDASDGLALSSTADVERRLRHGAYSVP